MNILLSKYVILSVRCKYNSWYNYTVQYIRTHNSSYASEIESNAAKGSAEITPTRIKLFSEY